MSSCWWRRGPVFRFRDLKEKLDRPRGLRSKIKLGRKGFRCKTGKMSVKSGLSARDSDKTETEDHPSGLRSKISFKWKGLKGRRGERSEIKESRKEKQVSN